MMQKTIAIGGHPNVLTVQAPWRCLTAVASATGGAVQRVRARGVAGVVVAIAVWVGLSSGCVISHSARTARTAPEGRVVAQFDARVQGRVDKEGVNVTDSLAAKAAIDIASGFLMDGGNFDMWIEYGATERLSVSVLLGLGTMTLAADVKLALIASSAFVLSGSVGYWGYPLGDNVHGYRVGLLTATALGGDVDLLFNGHIAQSLGSPLDMYGGAIGFDFAELGGFGLRPLFDYSYVPAGDASAHVLTLVIAVTYP